MLSLLSDIVRSCLLLYLSMAVGHLFARRRVVMSVAAFLALSLLSNLLLNLLTGLLVPEADLSLAFGTISGDVGPAAVVLPENITLSQITTGLISLAFSAVYFISTAWILEKKLNLE